MKRNAASLERGVQYLAVVELQEAPHLRWDQPNAPDVEWP